MQGGSKGRGKGGERAWGRGVEVRGVELVGRRGK